MAVIEASRPEDSHRGKPQYDERRQNANHDNRNCMPAGFLSEVEVVIRATDRVARPLLRMRAGHPCLFPRMARAVNRAMPAGAGAFPCVCRTRYVDLEQPALNLTHRWVRAGDWKLILFEDRKTPPELYNVKEDPFEEKTSRPRSRIAFES
jgi:hypothetical protein